jgi:hypothetical protein
MMVTVRAGMVALCSTRGRARGIGSSDGIASNPGAEEKEGNGPALTGNTRRKSREGRFVLVPDPKIVRTLLTTYASLRIAQAERDRPHTARELAVVSRELCATMGTTDLHEAIARADALLRAARGMAGGEPCGQDGVRSAA